MKFGVVTRGSQKIFILLNADCPAGGYLSVESKLRNGQKVPALVLKKNKELNEFVIVLPLLHADQKVTVVIHESTGEIVKKASKTIGHLASALQGKGNTLLKVHGVNEIRNFDLLSREDCSEIRKGPISGIGLENEGKELVSITVLAPCNDTANPNAPFVVRVYDGNGAEVPIEDVVALGDRTDNPVHSSEYLRRVIDVTFKKPRDINRFFVHVQFEGNSSPEAFVCFDNKHTEEVRFNNERRYSYTGLGSMYEFWFNETQAIPPIELEAQRSVRFEIEPSYSIIVPLYKTPPAYFDEMVESVINQTYANFELILVNASPEDEVLKKHVEECARNDKRVKVLELEENLGIALNTNEGIRAAQGDFLCFFDHDDVIEPNLLYEYTEAINQYPDTDLLYCDEDKLLENRYVDAFVKPDFSWDLLTTFNYVCHFLAVRKSVVDSIELSDESVSGAQDWDLTMKVAEKARNIYHVPKVLYHWRIHEGSTASGAEAKTYTHHAGETALKNHFERIGVPVRIHDAHDENSHVVEYLLPEQQPLVSIIIPNKDSSEMLEHLLDSIFEKTTYQNYEIVIVENNSTENETFDFYERIQTRHPSVKVFKYEGSFNFSAVCNYGALQASGDFFLFLNNDMEVITPNWIELLVGPALREDVGIVGAKLLFPNNTIQHAGVTVCTYGPDHIYFRVPRDYEGYFGLIKRKRDVLAVTGACLLVGREDFESIDGFDEEFVVEYNDVDFCMRMRERGRSVLIEPDVELYHFESVSRGHLNDSKEKLKRHERELALFRQRWGERMVGGDPHYGRNISDWSITYELNWGVRA